MEKLFRQLGFLLSAFLLRWLIWILIWLTGRTGILKTLFLIYPTDASECLDFCPNIVWLRNFFSGRPTPAGLIINKWRPIGIYLVIPDPALELMRRKNRPMIENIIKQMLWVKKLAGAETIGLAGQLGPIIEKRHGIPMVPPLYSSTYGNIFSIQKAVSHLVERSDKQSWQSSLAVVGGGLLGDQLMQYLGEDGYRMSLIDVRYTRKGDVYLANEFEANQQLAKVDYVINLLPRGKDFLACQLPEKISQDAVIVDFSRPPIPHDALPQRVVMGNRVQRKGMRFCFRLPGGWKSHELPACSMPSILAAVGGKALLSIEDFRQAARLFQFNTALAAEPNQQSKIYASLLSNMPTFHYLATRLIVFLTRERQMFGQ